MKCLATSHQVGSSSARTSNLSKFSMVKARSSSRLENSGYLSLWSVVLIFFLSCITIKCSDSPEQFPKHLTIISTSSEISAKISASTCVPSRRPSQKPSIAPTKIPSRILSRLPSVKPRCSPSKFPSLKPSTSPTKIPSRISSCLPSVKPSNFPSKFPSLKPSTVPITISSSIPSQLPSVKPSRFPSTFPSLIPSATTTFKVPTLTSTAGPSTTIPSFKPSFAPSQIQLLASPTPTITYSCPPSIQPTRSPSISTVQPTALSVVSTTSTTSAPTTSTDFSGNECISFLIPSYIYPSLWIPSNPWNYGLVFAAGGVAVLNPNSGDFSTVDPYQATALENAQKAGVKVIGYVSTRYGARSVVDVRENVGSYLSLYGSIDGFFLDELSSGAADLPHYANITSYIRQVGRLQGKSFIVASNPGTVPHVGYMDLADIVVVFEGSYSDFTTSYSAPAYQAQFQSSHFASIVYSVFSSSEVDAAVALSKQRNMGHIYLAGSDYSSLPPLIYRQAGLLSSCGVVEPTVLSNALHWLRSQQHASGLVQSFDGFLTDNAYSYDQAIAVIALLTNSSSQSSANFIAAKKTLTFLHEALLTVNGAAAAWRVPFAWSIETRQPIVSTSYSGTAAWVAEAFGLYWLLTGDARFSDAVVGISNWLVRRIGQRKCVMGSDTLTWCSTEHNIDAYFSLHLANFLTKNASYLAAANTIGATLTTSLWNSGQSRFQTGYNDASFSLDVQSWGSLWLVSSRYVGVDSMVARSDSALSFAEKFFFNKQTSVLLDKNGHTQIASGYGPYADSSNGFAANTVWSEGSLGVALAYLRRGKQAKAKDIVRGILPLVEASGGVLYAANRTVVDSSGDVFYPHASVAGTAWLAIVGSANQYLLWNADPALYAAASKSLV